MTITTTTNANANAVQLVLLRTVVLLLALTIKTSNSAGTDVRSCPPLPGGCGPFGDCVVCDGNDACVGERCKCTQGYTGGDCSIQVDYCPEAIHPVDNTITVCWNGGKCVQDNDVEYQSDFESGMNDLDFDELDELNNNIPEVRWRCDCSAAFGEAAAYAGHQCEYPAELSCVVGQNKSEYAYCVNGGQCLRMVQPGEAHPGCFVCPDFEGRHCQYAAGTAPLDELKFQITTPGNTNISGSSSDDGFSTWAKFVSACFVVSFVGVSAFVVYKHYAKKTADQKKFDSAKNATHELALDDNDNDNDATTGGDVLQGDAADGGGSNSSKEII
eukprot:CAMPEP_0198141174 /NCGR_PEP_ID=MMETSP1443-20131203/4219_1 /TAXON_ID=186043 /ORGANISM="Entomoneis sp., Strain CCMP2396" /LENGTH=328 /DNA_ID=CAMNT_0043803825 /DNA_START=75 /DNA_END=1061 /DNA_ORIENTATION=+